MSCLFALLIVNGFQNSNESAKHTGVDPELQNLSYSITRSYVNSFPEIGACKPKIVEALGKKYRDSPGNNSAIFILKLVLLDIEKVEKLKISNPKLLNEISANYIGMFSVKLYSSTRDNLISELKIIIANSDKLFKEFDETSHAVFLFWSFLSNFIFSNDCTIEPSRKEEFLEMHILPFYQKNIKTNLKTEIGLLSEYDECLFYREIYKKGSLKMALDQAMLLKNIYELKYGSEGDLNLIANYYKILARHTFDEDDRAIEEFKKIPQHWLDSDNPRLKSYFFRIYVVLSKIYKKKGDIEREELYLELAFSCAFANSLTSRLVVDSASSLRDCYLSQKKWVLLRNLEDRCLKFGLKPLPKQIGEE